MSFSANWLSRHTHHDFFLSIVAINTGKEGAYKQNLYILQCDFFFIKDKLVLDDKKDLRHNGGKSGK